MTRKYILPIVIFFATIQISGQERKTYAEKRQEAKTMEQNAEFFGEKDEFMSSNAVPEKWIDESAVILARKVIYNYEERKSGKLLYEEVTSRIKVKIQDKAALEEFSQFYFRTSKSKDQFGIKVIEADGTEEIINLSEAVDVGYNEVPDYYRYSYYNSYKKIAVPDLEIGDIVETYHVINSSEYTRSAYAFKPTVFALAKKYPIVKQRHVFNVEKGFKVNFRSLNGASKIKKMGAGENKYGRVTDRFTRFVFEDENREKLKGEYWTSPIVDQPSIKFQVAYISFAAARKTSILFNEEGLQDSKFDLDFIKNQSVRDEGFLYSHKEYKKELKKELSGMSAIEKADAVYQKIADDFRDIPKYSYYSRGRAYEREIINYKFVNSMLELLNDFDVKGQYVVIPSRFFGDFDAVTTHRELQKGVKVEDKYYFPCTNFSINTDIPSFVQGAPSLEFDYQPKGDYENISYTLGTIPVNNALDNNTEKIIEASIDENFENVEFELTQRTKGIGRKTNRLTYFYLEDTRLSMDPDEKEYEVPERGNRKKIEEAKRKKEEADKEKLDSKYEALKEIHEADFKVDEYLYFELLTVGRTLDEPSVSIKEKFTVKDLVSKAGKNYTFNLGELIGTQFQLEKDDMERESNIYMNYPKSFTNKILLQIPDGYKVEGLDSFNMNVDNKNGSFKSEIVIEGNGLILTTEKQYKTVSAEKSEWSDFIDFLEAAYNLSQKKIVLKKI